MSTLAADVAPASDPPTNLARPFSLSKLLNYLSGEARRESNLRHLAQAADVNK